MNLFVDTSAFYALNDAGEIRHDAAKKILEGLNGADRLFTSNYVIDEAVTLIRTRLGHHQAVGFAESAFASVLTSIVYVDRETELSALDVFKKFRDKKLSFTDCTTVALMLEHRWDAVFTFDGDFKKLGLRVVP